MKKIMTLGLIMMLLLTSSVMAAEDNNRFENIKAWFINDDENKTQNKTAEQERMQAEQAARVNAEIQTTNQYQYRINQSDIPEKAALLLEQMQIGERVRVQQQEKLFGLFNVDREVEYEKTITGATRVRKMFDFMYRFGAE